LAIDVPLSACILGIASVPGLGEEEMRTFFILLGISLTVFASHAFAADPGFCSNYSTAAVRQVQAARENPACRPGLMGTRWSPDYRVHYGWCITAPYGAAEEEREMRKRYLQSCRG
jgi:hypothetical protein